MNFEIYISKELNRLQYDKKTVELYSRWIRKLQAFYPDEDLKEIEFKKIVKYLKFLCDRKVGAVQSAYQAYTCLKTVYQKVLEKDYPFTSKILPARVRNPPIILSYHEIVDILNGTNKKRDRLIIATIYSIGLDVGEAIALKPEDIDFKNRVITYKLIRANKVRQAFLCDYLFKEIKQYLKEDSPQTWLFEGNTKGNQIGTSTVQRIFKKAQIEAGITKKAPISCLKYSYIYHLIEENVGIDIVLEDMRIFSWQSWMFYKGISPEPKPIRFSPLDIAIYGETQGTINIKPLERQLINISNDDERMYLKEAINCIYAKSLKAGVIFAWTAAIRNIHQKIIDNHKYRIINPAIKRHSPNSNEIKRIDDFAYTKDSVTLKVFKDLGEIDKNEFGILVECLDLRNKCSHPSNYQPKPLKVMSFMEDLISIVFSK